MIRTRFLTALTLTALLLFGCANPPAPATSPASSAPAPAPVKEENKEAKQETAGSEGEKKKKVELKMSEFAFAPNKISTEVGTLLEFQVTNEGKVEHEIVIDAPEAEFEVEVKPNLSADFAVKFRKPGIYAFKCEIPGHLEAGMKGEIVVGGGDAGGMETPSAGAGEEKKQELSIAMSEFKFDPAEVKTKAGTLLEIDLSNRGTVEHEMVIDTPAAEFEVEAKEGTNKHFGLKFRKSGTYEYKCEIPGHLEAGMKGKFVVQ